MGMFDYVNYEEPCKECGTLITEWQTKDSECSLSMVETKEIDYFYGDCPECGTWYNKKVNRVCIVQSIEDGS